jgi:hypothetical protein
MAKLQLAGEVLMDNATFQGALTTDPTPRHPQVVATQCFSKVMGVL